MIFDPNGRICTLSNCLIVVFAAGTDSGCTVVRSICFDRCIAGNGNVSAGSVAAANCCTSLIAMCSYNSISGDFNIVGVTIFTGTNSCGFITTESIDRAAGNFNVAGISNCRVVPLIASTNGCSIFITNGGQTSCFLVIVLDRKRALSIVVGFSRAA